MPYPYTSIHDLSNIAETVARATNVQAALDALIAEVSRVLDTCACIFERAERGWMLVAQTRGGLRVSMSDLHVALNGVSSDDLTTVVDLRAIGAGMWTAMSLKDPGGPLMAMLLAGDWTILDSTLNSLAVFLSFALRSVRDREVRRHAERLLVDGYTMARRLSRLGGLDVVCQRVVEQVSRSLGADRVALALYRPEEDRLVVAATHGYSPSVINNRCRSILIESNPDVFSKSGQCLVNGIVYNFPKSFMKTDYIG